MTKKHSEVRQEIFSGIYERNSWGGQESISGPGSSVYETRYLIRELPLLLRDYGITSMLDIPCGDFHWMKNVDLSNLHYIGADIVDELLERNTQQYANDAIQFKKLDLITDALPKVDLIFCRDCLVHFTYADIFRALHNICNSQSTYLLTTTFPVRTTNHDIETGKWRPLNLLCAPFNFATPIRFINEGCEEGQGAYADKTLCLFKIADIQAHLNQLEAQLLPS